MEKYSNISRRSNVEAFENGGNYIIVKFKKSSRLYKYSYNSAGSSHVENMKNLAINGSGLNSYIKLNVNNSFER